MLNWKSRFDWPLPVLAHLGEQSILNKEIFAQGPAVLNSNGTPVDDDTFAYQERFAEARFYPSLITGKFRSGIPGGSLDVWHYGQDYSSLPVLNPAFIADDSDTWVSRTIENQTEPQFKMDMFWQVRKVRPLPVYGVPGMMDHF